MQRSAVQRIVVAFVSFVAILGFAGIHSHAIFLAITAPVNSPTPPALTSTMLEYFATGLAGLVGGVIAVWMGVQSIDQAGAVKGQFRSAIASGVRLSGLKPMNTHGFSAAGANEPMGWRDYIIIAYIAVYFVVAFFAAYAAIFSKVGAANYTVNLALVAFGVMLAIVNTRLVRSPAIQP